jgi:hypothetical protein
MVEISLVIKRIMTGSPPGARTEPRISSGADAKKSAARTADRFGFRDMEWTGIELIG